MYACAYVYACSYIAVEIGHGQTSRWTYVCTEWLLGIHHIAIQSTVRTILVVVQGSYTYCTHVLNKGDP